jgi:hypothetical protein
MTLRNRPIIRLDPSATISASSFACQTCKGDAAYFPKRNEPAVSASRRDPANSDKSDALGEAEFGR